MKPDGVDEPKAETAALGPGGADGGTLEKSGLIKSVFMAATGQGAKKPPDEAALEAAEKRAEASAKEAIRASQAALAAQETARKAAEEAAMEARNASQAALAAQAALKEAQAAKVAIAARRAADRAAEKAAGEAARDAARDAAREAATKAAELVAQHSAAREAAEEAARAAALEAAERAAREEAERAAQVAARRAADEAAREAVKAAAKEAAEKAAKEAQAARIAQADKVARATRAARAAKAARAARAEKLAKRAAEKAGVLKVHRPKRLNLKLVVSLPVAAALAVAGVFALHAAQVARTATVMLEKAEKALAEGDKDEGIRFFTHYVNYRPRDYPVFSRLALLMAERSNRPGSDPRHAFGMLERAASQDQDNDEVLRQLADFSMRVGRIKEAISHLTLLRERFPEDLELAVKLGDCQIRDEKYRDAMATFEQVTAQDHNNLAAYVALANLLRDKLDDADRAEAVINQMVSVNSKSVKAYLERARYWQRGKSIKEAKDDIRRALELDPNNASVLITAAQFATDNKDFEEAKEYLDKAEALHPDDPSVERARTVLNLTLGETEKVLDYLQKQIKREESRDVADLLTVADLQLRKGDLKAVRETIKKMREAGFREEIMRYFDARVEVAEGKWREASYTLERLRPNVAGWPEFLTQVDLLLGACYEQLRLPDRQLSTYQELLNRDPSLNPARAGYASSLFRTGKLDEAAAEYEKLEKSMGEEFLKTPALRNSFFQLIIARTMRLPENYRDWSELETFVEKLSKVEGVDEVQLTLMRAEVLAKKGDIKKAREVVQAGLDKHGKDAALWNASAKLAGMAEGPKEGLRVLGLAAEQAGNDPLLMLTRADLAVQLGPGQGEAVLAALALDVEKLPEIDKVRLWRGLGAAYYRLRDSEKARQYWQLVANSPQRDPQMLLVLFELARESDNEEQMKEATAAVKKLLGSRSSEAEYCESSELVWKAQRGKIDKKELILAKQMLAEAANERPSWHEIPRLEAEIALLEDKPDEAIKQFQRASELGPLSPVYLGQLVQLLFARGRYEEAREVVNKLGRSQVSLTMKRLEAELNFRLGDFPQALELAAQAVKNSDRATDYLWYGELLARTRKYAEAQAQFRKAVELDPKIPEAWVGLVAILVEEGKKDEAQRMARQAQASLPEEETPLVMAQCSHLLGDPGRAEQYYLSALAQHPEDLAVIRQVARFYMITGRSEEARRYIGQILLLAGRDPEKHQVELVEARRWMARVLAAGGDWRALQQALGLLDRNAKDGQLPTEDLRLKAAMLAGRSDQQSLQRAIDLLEEIRDERKQELSPQEQFALARLYDKTHRWTTARDLMRELIQKDPKEPQYLAAYIQMMFDHDTPVSAIELLLGKLEEIARNAPGTKVLKARLLIKKGQTAEGVALVKSLVPKPLAQDKVAVLRQAAALLEDLGQLDAARELLDEFAQKTPGGGLAVAAFLGRHGTTDEALDQVEASLPQASPAAVLPVVVAIFTEQRKTGTITPEQFARAEVWFKQAAEQAPYNKFVQLQTASLRDVQGDYVEQIRLYRQFLSRGDVLDRDKAVIWNNLAFLLAVTGDPKKEALKMIDQAIELLGPVPELLDTRAVALIAAGNNKAAVEDLQRAIADNPSAIMYFHLAQAHMAAGDSRSAARVFQVARDNYQLTAEHVPKVERDSFQKLVAAMKAP